MKKAVELQLIRCDIVINCAGALFSGDIENTYPQDFDYLCDLNVRAPFLITQFFTEMLQATQGCIVNVCCNKGSRPEPGMISYCMTKAGLEMLTKSSAVELAPLGIRVNAVSPATTHTNLYKYAGLTKASNEAFEARAAKNIPL
mmetsp:Transcript_15567/g.10937  ORF Transcript_15567/g.10937 Transcript_15567/m.10937 type:complete len:144 (+) Transcript_15567:395-826(+)